MNITKDMVEFSEYKIPKYLPVVADKGPDGEKQMMYYSVEIQAQIRSIAKQVVEQVSYEDPEAMAFVRGRLIKKLHYILYGDIVEKLERLRGDVSDCQVDSTDVVERIQDVLDLI